MGTPLWCETGRGPVCTLHLFLRAKTRKIFLFFAARTHLLCAAGVDVLRAVRLLGPRANLPMGKVQGLMHVFSVREMHLCSLPVLLICPRDKAFILRTTGKCWMGFVCTNTGGTFRTDDGLQSRILNKLPIIIQQIIDFLLRTHYNEVARGR